MSVDYARKMTELRKLVTEALTDERDTGYLSIDQRLALVEARVQSALLVEAIVKLTEATATLDRIAARMPIR